MRNVLAIDPGASGGFAWRDSENQVHCCAMPETEGDVLEKLRELKALGIKEATVEAVCGFIPAAGAGAMFTFGSGFGFLKGCLMALGFRLVLVRPQKWQAALSLGKKKEHGKDWKKHLRANAQRLFPTADVTLKTADALLLLEYATIQP